MATVAGMNLFDLVSRQGEQMGRGLNSVLNMLTNQYAMRRLGNILEGGMGGGGGGELPLTESFAGPTAEEAMAMGGGRGPGPPYNTVGLLARVLRDPWMSPQVKQAGIELVQNLQPEAEQLQFLEGEDQFYGVGKETGTVRPTGIPSGKGAERPQQQQRTFINAINAAMAPYLPDQTGISFEPSGMINLGGFKNKYNELQRIINDPTTPSAEREKARRTQRNVDHWIEQVSNIAGQAPEETPKKGGRKALADIF